MLKAHGKGIMEEEAQIQPKESAKGLYGYGQVARPSPSISPVPHLVHGRSCRRKFCHKPTADYTNEQEKDPIYT